MQFTAYIRGEGPLKEKIKKYIMSHAVLKGKVFFINKVPFSKIPELYKHSTLFVHTCSREPFGMIVLEAMGSGLPVIVPKSGGAYEISQGCSLSFEPSDSIDLTEKIISVADDQNLYEKMSKRSIEKAKTFTWTKSAKQYYATYAKRVIRG
jgi:glycosyltransferase involved in cell wall biosynthesis